MQLSMKSAATGNQSSTLWHYQKHQLTMLQCPKSNKSLRYITSNKQNKHKQNKNMNRTTILVMVRYYQCWANVNQYFFAKRV